MSGAPPAGSGWMAGALRAGVAAVGPGAEVVVAVATDTAGRIALVEALGRGAEASELAAAVAASEQDGAQLREQLATRGVPAHIPAPLATPGVRPLAAVVKAAAIGELPPAGVVATAEEALVLPEGIDGAHALDALRRFVSGLRPDGRLEAYALLAAGAGVVVGDAWDPEALRSRLDAAQLPAGAVGVVPLTGDGPVWSVAPEALGGLGAGEAHRLGPVLRSWAAPSLQTARGPLERWLAEVAVADLAHPSSSLARLTQGVGGHARVVAHAEAAERYAASRHEAAALVQARRSELEGAIDPRTIICGNARQEEGSDAEGRRPWCAAWTRDGARRWVPAEAVFLSVGGPSATSSSGLAAHLDPVDARRRAFCELIERDAFMWTWIKRVSRPRIAATAVPADAAAWAGALASAGWETTWVDLTLDTLPVVLCCAVSATHGLTLGAACDADPAQAVRRATQEALVLALHHARRATAIAAEEVRDPADHGVLHRDPSRSADSGFLYGSAEVTGLGAPVAGEPEELLEAIGIEPLTVELTRPESAPFRVVRALAPGLVPIRFGWDREPLGMPRLSGALPSPHGPVGGVCNLTSGRGTVPHPFS